MSIVSLHVLSIKCSKGQTMKAWLAGVFLFIIAACDDGRVVESTAELSLRDDEQSFLKQEGPIASNTLSYFAIDAFADAVATNGVNNQGQGFTDPAGVLGVLEVLDLTKSPPVLGVGVNGFVVVDMGAGEEIVSGPGVDFMVIEADGSLLAAGFGLSEPLAVSVSNSPTGPFVDLGSSVGSGFFDLQNAGLAAARYVRLQDAGGVPPSGADLQGIAAFNFKGADFKLLPHIISRSRNARNLIGVLRVPEGFNAASASIVLIAALHEPSPAPAPFAAPLNITGTFTGNGSVVMFNSAEFLDAASDGDNIVVIVKLTSSSDEILYLFDLVSIQP